jgi:hypothetical protein
MFNYNVYAENSIEEFRKVCERIEKAFPNVEKLKILIDVDGSTVQTYVENGKDIDVYNDYEVGAVYIKSEIDIALAINDLVA